MTESLSETDFFQILHMLSKKLQPTSTESFSETENQPAKLSLRVD